MKRIKCFLKAVKEKRIIPFTVAGIMMLFAICMLLYPLISNYLANTNCSQVRAEYYETINQTNNSAVIETVTAAQEYNSSLRSVQFGADSKQSPQKEYNDLLNLNGNGIMGYIEIPDINVYLPIYHGTSEESLQSGVGHLIGSSLPIGGAGTHTVLTGHSGVVGKRLFSDLEQLRVGDVFYLHVIKNTLCYKVTEIHTVEPNDISLLAIKENKDRCTLITCTPFGVNTHRLLVQADRISAEEAQQLSENNADGSAPTVSTWKKQYYSGLIFGGIILLFVFLIFFICKEIKRLKHNKKR